MAASDANVLTSYLIKLGYSVDKVQQATFESAAGRAGQVVGKVTTGFIAGFASLVGLGTAATLSMNNLYYAAQRAGSNPLTFRAYTEAFSQIGGQADALSATLQNIGFNLESSPAARFFATAFTGKDTTDSIAALEGLIDRYNKLKRDNPNGSEVLQRNLINQFASQLGADPTVLRQILLNPEEFRARFAQRSTALGSVGLSNSDVREAAQLTNDFKGALSDLYSGLMKVSVQAFPPITEKLNEFSAWFKEHPDEVSEKIEQIGRSFEIVGDAISVMVTILEKAVQLFGFLSDNGLLGIVGGGLTGLVTAGPVGALAGAFIGGTAELGYDAYKAATKTDAGQASTGAFDPVSFFQNRLGLTREQSAALVGNLKQESGLNPAAFNPAGGGRGAQGIAQWRGDRLEAAERFFGGPVRGASLQRQSEFVAEELLGSQRRALDELRRAQGLTAQTVAVRRYYERPGENEANDAQRVLYARQALGASAATGGVDVRAGTSQSPYVLQSKVEINVNATNSNGREIGNAVKLGTERVMQDAIRNFADRTTGP